MTKNNDYTVDGHGDVYPSDHPSQAFWHEDGFSMTGNPGVMSPDTITFDLIMDSKEKIDLNLDATSKNGFWKYEEDKTLMEVRDYFLVLIDLTIHPRIQRLKLSILLGALVTENHSAALMQSNTFPVLVKRTVSQSKTS